LTYIIYFDTYDFTHNGDEPPKDAGISLLAGDILTSRESCAA